MTSAQKLRVLKRNKRKFQIACQNLKFGKKINQKNFMKSKCTHVPNFLRSIEKKTIMKIVALFLPNTLYLKN